MSVDMDVSPSNSFLSYASEFDSPLFEGLDAFEEWDQGLFAHSCQSETSPTPAIYSPPLLDPYLSGSSTTSLDDAPPQASHPAGDDMFAPLDQFGEFAQPQVDQLTQVRHHLMDAVRMATTGGGAMVTIPVADLAVLLAAVHG
ncbi:hypothetical protein HK104_005870, partial [Borealophlyctis nickersoniae]